MFVKKIFFIFALCFYIFNCYTLADNYVGDSFFNQWNYFTGNDPTNGYVNYLSLQQAQQENLARVENNIFYMSADATNIASGRGRNSIRITSNKAYNRGLFVVDLNHMPQGCGTWPAFWMVGPNWPNGGEIDIIEGVNNNVFDQTTLHTNDGCVQSSSNNDFNGRWSNGTNNQPATNCYINAPNQADNQGCGIVPNQANTYGVPFNNIGGGIYATEWTNNVIRSWFFTHPQTPLDLKNNVPKPSTWGKPYASFSLGNNCPSSHFSNMNIVFDLTFCGDWAGAVFPNQCMRNITCQNWVQNYPYEFKQAYWSVNYVKVFQ